MKIINLAYRTIRLLIGKFCVWYLKKYSDDSRPLNKNLNALQADPVAHLVRGEINKTMM